MTAERLPSWASKLALSVIGALLMAGIGIGIADRETLSEHETRISVNESRLQGMDRTLEKMDDKLDTIIDCQRKQEQGRDCE